MDELTLWFKVPELKSNSNAGSHGKHRAKTQPTYVQDIEVEVLLMVGGDSFPFRTQVKLSHSNASINLADAELKPTMGNPAGGIQVPLISELARSVDERIQTSLYVNIQWHGQTLYRHTHTVSLTPTNEWSLTDEDICWLPSFVQPRDPAVGKIIASANKYLRCLTDGPTAGFVGYQAKDTATVDAQVKAIWMALIFEYRLEYICPPPSYSPNSQRLRTPSEIVFENHGTCLDLTLLFVSCLEWIELFPVILQTDVHAFAGYWVSESARDDFLAMQNSEKKHAKTGEKAGGALDDLDNKDASLSDKPWICKKHNYNEIRERIFNDQIIPLECVSLTENASVNEAWNLAKEYFAFTKLEVQKRFAAADEYLDECTVDYNEQHKTKVEQEASLHLVEKEHRTELKKLNTLKVLSAEKHKDLAAACDVEVEHGIDLNSNRCKQIAETCQHSASECTALFNECATIMESIADLAKKCRYSKSKLLRAQREFATANLEFEAEKEYYDAARAELEHYQDYEPPIDGNIDPKTPPHGSYYNFHSMIDVCTARAFVTPLPLSK
jgi:hypothetical protein